MHNHQLTYGVTDVDRVIHRLMGDMGFSVVEKPELDELPPRIRCECGAWFTPRRGQLHDICDECEQNAEPEL